MNNFDYSKRIEQTRDEKEKAEKDLNLKRAKREEMLIYH